MCIRDRLSICISAHVVVDPAERALDRAVPEAQAAVAILGPHSGHPASALANQAAELIEARPDPGREASRERGTESGRFEDLGPHHVNAEHVGLKLHHHVADRATPVDAKLAQAHSGVGRRGLDHLDRLVDARLARRPHEVRTSDEAGESLSLIHI